MVIISERECQKYNKDLILQGEEEAAETRARHYDKIKSKNLYCLLFSSILTGFPEVVNSFFQLIL